jgi:hypothetical protein
MKRRVSMKRQFIGNYEVLQRTEDSYFDANYVLQQWNSRLGNTPKRLSKFLELKSTQEFIGVITSRELENTENVENQEDYFSNQPDFQAVKIIKSRTYSNGVKTVDKVWMHPYLFIDYCMWLDAEFKYDVVKAVYDKMIVFRHYAGDFHRAMCKAVASIVESSSKDLYQ